MIIDKYIEECGKDFHSLERHATKIRGTDTYEVKWRLVIFGKDFKGGEPNFLENTTRNYWGETPIEAFENYYATNKTN